MKLHHYSTDLINELDKAYPSRPANLQDSDREIWFKAGQRSVVDTLLSLLKDKTEMATMPTLLNNNEEE